METYGIDLIGDRHDDGTVTFSSPDLPLFCVVGASDKEALNIAMRVLPEYLKTNVPDFVELRQIPSATELLGATTGAVLRAHVIAMTAKGRSNGTEGSTHDR
jgi:hypothetical protein